MYLNSKHIKGSWIKHARCATWVNNKGSETFSDRKILFQHELSIASLQSSKNNLISTISLC